MIIRAVSDSESDDERGGGSTSGFGAHPTFPSAQERRGGAARLAWVAVSVGVVALVLADVAALAGLLTRAPAPLGVADEFALLPMTLALALPAADGVSVVRAAPASALNHWAGLALVSAWILAREAADAAASLRRRWLWVAAVAAIGHAASCVYVLTALLESNGDRAKFWGGARRRRPARAAYP